MEYKQTLIDSISSGLSSVFGKTMAIHWVRDLSGGDINCAALIRHKNKNFFLKYHPHSPADMFVAEALALTEIAAHGCIKVPAPIAHGNDGNTAWLVLEYLELTSSGPANMLGKHLAALHRVSSDQYGWSRNNNIGTTPQINTPHDDWSVFWRDCRLKPQLAMAKAGGHGNQLEKRGGRLLEVIDRLLAGHQPDASLLHGDLWAGNKAFTAAGQAVIFDPASYHGDRETDIAMSELFGGFESGFYAAYNAHYPLPDGYHHRRDLYNLYHVLNHLNLFGKAYLSRAVSMIDGLLAQVY